MFKMKIVIKVIYIIILFFLFSCSEDERRISLNETFVLQYGETKTLDGDHLSVTFSSLTGDSRCPANATCIWAGQAIVQIDIQEGMQSHPTELVIGTLSEDQKSKTVINHYQVELLKVIPYPEIPEVNIPADQYAVQLIITSL